MCKSAFYLLIAAIVVFNLMEYAQADRDCQTYCSKHGKCNGGLCTCMPGYKGFGCRSCVKSPGCQHGVCEGQNGCKCHPGWAGENCDIKLDIDCQNSGVAKINSRGLFECSCPAGFEGEHCESKTHSSPLTCPVDERQKCDLLNQDCMVTNKGGYLCYCMHGMNEKLKCRNSTDFCEKKQGKSPCRNNGTCYSYKNTFKCVCREGFIGKLCQRSQFKKVPAPTTPKKVTQKVEEKKEDEPKNIQLNINSPNTNIFMGKPEEKEAEKKPQQSGVTTAQEDSSNLLQLLFILFFVVFFIGLFVFGACVCKERIRNVMNRNKSSKAVITIKRSGSGEQYQVKESGNHQGNQVTKVVIETGTAPALRTQQISQEESKVPFISSSRVSDEGLSSEEEGDYMDSFKFREKSSAIMTSQHRSNFHQSGDGAECKSRCQETLVPQKGKYLPDVTVV